MKKRVEMQMEKIKVKNISGKQINVDGKPVDSTEISDRNFWGIRKLHCNFLNIDEEFNLKCQRHP